MDEFGPDEQRWLDVLRAADEPSADDRARVRAAVITSVASAGGASAAAAGIAKSGVIAKTSGAAGIFAGSWKIGVAVVGFGLAGLAGGIAAVTLGGASTRRAPVAIASAVSTHALVPVPDSKPAAENQAAGAPKPIVTAPDEATDAPKSIASTTARAPVRASASRTPAASPGADDVEAEFLLLTQAQRALERGDPNAALGALARHGREHPHGALAVEREGLRAIASCEAKRGDGRSLAERFVAKNPTSPLVARVRAACLSP